MKILNLIFSFYYSMEGACLAFQKKFFGRYLNEMWAYRVLDITTGLFSLLIIYLLSKYVLTSVLLSIALGMVAFAPLLAYYSMKKPGRTACEDKIKDFYTLNYFYRTLFLIYMVVFFGVLPLGIIILIVVYK
ncbi:hypothetical protein [Arcticibacter tournemirensis]